MGYWKEIGRWLESGRGHASDGQAAVSARWSLCNTRANSSKLSPAYRGHIEFKRFEETGTHECIACGTCQRTCPSQRDQGAGCQGACQEPQGGDALYDRFYPMQPLWSLCGDAVPRRPCKFSDEYELEGESRWDGVIDLMARLEEKSSLSLLIRLEERDHELLIGTESIAQMAFWIVVGLTFGGAVIAVFPRNILYNVLGLALALAGVAGLYLYLGSFFIALMQLLIYVGAISIAIVFAIMLSRPLHLEVPKRSVPKVAMAAAASVDLFCWRSLAWSSKRNWVPAAGTEQRLVRGHHRPPAAHPLRSGVRSHLARSAGGHHRSDRNGRIQSEVKLMNTLGTYLIIAAVLVQPGAAGSPSAPKSHRYADFRRADAQRSESELHGVQSVSRAGTGCGTDHHAVRHGIWRLRRRPSG